MYCTYKCGHVTHYERPYSFIPWTNMIISLIVTYRTDILYVPLCKMKKPLKSFLNTSRDPLPTHTYKGMHVMSLFLSITVIDIGLFIGNKLNFRLSIQLRTTETQLQFSTRYRYITVSTPPKLLVER